MFEQVSLVVTLAILAGGSVFFVCEELRLLPIPFDRNLGYSRLGDDLLFLKLGKCLW